MQWMRSPHPHCKTRIKHIKIRIYSVLVYYVFDTITLVKDLDSIQALLLGAIVLIGMKYEL